MQLFSRLFCDIAANGNWSKPLGYRINIFIARICFRGIYFPQMGPSAWLKLIHQNRRTIFGLTREGFATWRERAAAVPIASAGD